MDFALSDEQSMIVETVSRFVAQHYDGANRWERPADREYDPVTWTAMTDLGLLGLLVPEVDGGFGGGAAEIMLVMAAFGRGLATLPFTSSAIIGTRLLQDTSAILAGSMRIALGWQEPGRGYDRNPRSTVARKVDGKWVVSGAKTLILDVAGATHIAITACIAADDRAVVFLLPREDIEIGEMATVDGRTVGECILLDIVVPDDALLDDGFARLAAALDLSIFALCAEATGAMEALLDLTIEYLRMRHQFDQPIGRFQALQHRIAEMQSALEAARSIVLHAVAAQEEGDAVHVARAISAAKVMIGEAGRFIGQNAVQLHGGIGVTDALSIGHYFKRLTCIEMTGGDGEHHLARYLELDVDEA